MYMNALDKYLESEDAIYWHDFASHSPILDAALRGSQEYGILDLYLTQVPWETCGNSQDYVHWDTFSEMIWEDKASNHESDYCRGQEQVSEHIQECKAIIPMAYMLIVTPN